MNNEKKTVLTALSDTAGQGLKIIALVAAWAFLFLIPNLTCIGFGVAGFFKVEFTRYVLLYFGLILLASAAGAGVAALFMYEYFLIDTIRILYAYLTPLFKILCKKIAGRISEGNKGVLKKGYDWSESVADSFQEAYNQKVPRLIRAAIKFILSQIAFADIMYHISIDARTEDKEALGASIYTQLDSYIHTKFFEENTMKWTLWFLPLNIGLNVLFIFLMRR
jgi:hypothetical protein